MICPCCDGRGSVGPDIEWQAHECAEIYRTRALFTAMYGDDVYVVVQDGEPDEDDIGWYVMRAFADELGKREWLRKDSGHGRMLAANLSSKANALLAAHRDMEERAGATKAERDQVRKLESQLAAAKARMAR